MGASLFDPDRYPFLEGLAQCDGWQTIPSRALEITNRVALHLLKSLQMLQVKVPGGGPAEARRVIFVALDIGTSAISMRAAGPTRLSS